jgi:hypothetical protein
VARSSNRQSLRDARQYTPDQIMDETHERLSPREAIRNARHESYDQVDLRSTKRTDWPEEPPNLPFEARLPVPTESEPQGRKRMTSQEREGSSEAYCTKGTTSTASTMTKSLLRRVIRIKSLTGPRKDAPIVQILLSPGHTRTRLSISRRRLLGTMMVPLTWQDLCSPL